MPRCSSCRASVCSEDLWRVGGGALVCLDCVSVVGKEKETMTRSTSIFSVDILELEDDKGKDHQIKVQGSYGGLNVQFESTVDQIRDFFTKRRERKKAAELEAGS